MRIEEITESNVEIDRSENGRAVASLKSHNSMVYSKLALKVQRIEELDAEVKQLKSEVKIETREHVASLFTAEDEINTRVVDTVSFILTLSKNPKPTETLQYSKILGELEKQLTPELIQVLLSLKEKFKSVVQKEPSLKITAKESMTESIIDMFKGWVNKLYNWLSNYDNRLRRLKEMAKLS